MEKRFFLAAVIFVSNTSMICAEHTGHRYAGGDISLLPEYEQAGAEYKTHDGKPIADVLGFFKESGMNAMRVRLFVDPKAYHGEDADANACQDLDYIIPLCRRIKEEGLALVLDFHYSDTWADPAKQYTPAAWADMDDEELEAVIYSYTAETLRILKEEGATPDYIQTGNEISYGILWGPEGTSEEDQKKTFIGKDANWDRLCNLLKQAGKACRSECPNAGIILHTERTSDIAVQNNFYREMEERGVDYDVIGLSYYPYFHGDMAGFDSALSSLDSNFPSKEIMVVETGYSYKWKVPGTSQDVDYEYSDAGQNQFAKELVATLERHPSVTGLFWWWMEYNAYGTSLSGWYNAALFDSTTGRATSALKTISSFAITESGVTETVQKDVADGPDGLFDILGRRTMKPDAPGFYLRKGRKTLVK